MNPSHPSRAGSRTFGPRADAAADALRIVPMLALAMLLLLAALAVRAQDAGGKIVIGQSVALTGPQAALAKPFHDGARLYFERLNAAGGIGGRKIELVALDDGGVPANATANTKRLVDQGVFALFGYYGSAQVKAAYPSIADSETLLFAPMAGAEELGGTLFPNVYLLRPGFAFETHAMVRHAERLGAKKFAILHGNDAESLAALETGEPTMAGLGVNLLFKGPLAAVDKVVAARPESVLVISDANAAAKVIKDLRGKGYRGLVYAYSNAGESLLAEQLGADGAGVVVARVVPKSDSAKVQVVRELIADAKEAKLADKPNVYMLEGYIAARTFAEALRRAAPRGSALTQAKLRKAVEALDDLSIGGFRVHFAGGRVASKLVELSLIDSSGKVRE
jgi:ABC-type branched-subunit amino acid transport system substrate-binding protein